MKRLTILLFVFAFLFSATTFGRVIEITKKSNDGGERFIEERHEDGWWIYPTPTSKFFAENATSEDFKWLLDPSSFKDMIGPNGSNPEWKDLYDYAIDAIQNQNLNGSHKSNIAIQNDFWKREVKWKSNSKDEFYIEICIEYLTD